MSSIGIAGFGVVGQAVYGSIGRRFIELDEVIVYDPPKGRHNFNQLLDCGAIFVCLPTPMLANGKQDFQYVERLLVPLKQLNYPGLVIIKSTCLWENIEPWCSKLRIVVNPEFLNANNAVKDFEHQTAVILGGPIDDCGAVESIYRDYFVLTAEPPTHYVTHRQACEIKYIHNIWHAYRVLFWNWVQEVTGNERLIAGKVCAVTGTTPEAEKARICADGRRGYGGKCFVKDTAAMAIQHPHELLKFMRRYNKAIRGEPEE